MLLAGLLAGGITVSVVWAQSGVPAATPQAAAAPSTIPATKPMAGEPYRYHPNPFPKRAEAYYGLYWGIDSLGVKYAESGEIINFSYHVLDAEKARALNDKKSEPILVDPQAGVKLVIPSLEKVGQLRQSSTPEAGKSYWMAFSNKGRLVHRGDRVIIVIGQFKAEGLIVE